MYKVVNWCQQDGDKAYAIMDTVTGGIELVSEGDLVLLTFVGLEMQTISGEPVRIEGDSLICDVAEYIPAEEIESDLEDDDCYDISVYDASDDAFEGDDSEDKDADNIGTSDCDESDQNDIEFYDVEDTDEDDSTQKEGNEVRKLYALLDQKQITVLRRYYLWFSQRLFTSSEKDKTYGLTSKAAIISKSQKLNNLRNGGDYRYAGWLDTGSVDAGYTCSLGHRLRYLHLAWDITYGDVETAFFGEDYSADYAAIIKSNNCIVFGEKCVGDFFEVDDSCKFQLRRTQEQSLKDMLIMYHAYLEGDVSAIKDSFRLLDSVIKVIHRYDLKRKMFGNFEPTIPLSVVSFYQQFREVDLIPPKSLIQEIRSCLVGWTDGKRYFSNKWTGELHYPYDSFYERLKVIAGSDYSGVVDALYGCRSCLRGYGNLTGMNSLLVYVYLMFTYEICGYYKYTATKDGFNDEGGYNKSSVGRQLPALYNNSLHKKIVGGEFSLDCMRRMFDLAKVCVDAKAKYKSDTSLPYNVPYFSTMSGQVYEDSIKLDIFQSMPNQLKKLISECFVDDEERNRFYAVNKFMSDVVFQHRDMMQSLLSNSVLLHNQELKPCVIDRKYDILVISGVVGGILSDFDALYDKLLQFCTDKCEKDKVEYEQKKAEEAKKQAEEDKKQEASKVSGASTPKDVVDYLMNANMSSVVDAEFDMAKKILDTLKKSGKAPSSRQFYYLKPLYEELSGEKYAGDTGAAQKVELSSRQDIVDAIAWMEFAPVRAKAVALELGVADFDKLTSILNSIKRYGKISERQMPYAEKAVEIMTEGKK